MGAIVNTETRWSKWLSISKRDRQIFIGYYSIVVIVVMLFGYTAFMKFADYKMFVFQMQLAPAPLMTIIAPTLGWLVPSVEIVVVVGLFMDRTRKYALILTAILMIIFNTYIIIMLLSGLDLPCTCGGIISKMSWKAHLLFNFTILLMSYWAVKNHIRTTSIEGRLANEKNSH